MLVKRKAIQLSRQTLVVSLPSKWVKKNTVSKGDELDISIHDQELVIRTTLPRIKQSVKKELSLKGLNERTVRWVLSGLHKQGVDEMVLSFDNSTHLPVVSDVTKNLFIGMALVKQNENGCVIKSLAHEDPSTFDNTLRRSFQVTLSMADALYHAMKDNDFESLKGIRELEKTNNQLTNFCQRLLNAGFITNSSKTNFLYVISWNLEKVCDDYKYICEHLMKHEVKSSPEIVGYLNSVNNYLRSYYELFYGFSLSKLNSLSEQKDNLLHTGMQLISSHDFPENAVAIHIHNLCLKIVDFSTTMFSYHQ